MSWGKPCRVIRGLISAEPASRPKNLPKSRPRGRKAAGLRYERDLAEGLCAALTGIYPVWHGQWFKFLDANGPGFCQPDILLKTDLGTAVLEAKYTWTEAGHVQIGKLYVPVLEKACPGMPAFGIVVCKVLRPEVCPDWICRDLQSAIIRASSGEKTVLHWVGAGLNPLRIAA